MRIQRLEIVTVSTRGARVHWRAPAGGDFEFAFSSRSSTSKRMASVSCLLDRYYLAELGDLEPDMYYRFSITPKGASSPSARGGFRTLEKPRGEYLFRFATINDIHIGEDENGLILLPGLDSFPLTPGFKLDIDGHPFWRYTNETVIDELNAHELDFVVVKGDLSSHHLEEELIEAKEMLSKLAHPYHVLRGNHDMVGDMPEDYFLKTFQLEQSWQSFEHMGFGFILIDNVQLSTGFCAFPREELDWLKGELKRMKKMPVFVFLHSPPLRLIGRVPLNRTARFMRILNRHRNIAGVLYGHTHGNKLQKRLLGRRLVPFAETAATVDQPGGYNIYEVYSGGYTQMCIRPFEPRCCRWYEEAEKTYFGLATSMLTGEVGDRNFSHSFNR